MTWQQLVQALREEFVAQLRVKTGWGRNEVMQAFERALTEALARFVGKR